MENNPAKKEAIMPHIILGILTLKSFILKNSSTTEPNIIGMLSKKLKFAHLLLSAPKIIPKEIVVPLRLMAGNSAIH